MKTHALALGSSIVAMATLMITAGTASAHPLPRDGGFISLSLGGATVSGDRGVPLKADPRFTLSASPGDPLYDDNVRTDAGGGAAFEIRFGALLGGFLTIEGTVGGHGDFGFDDGAGYAGAGLRWHPVQHAIERAERDWDVSLFANAGYAISGYLPELDDDNRGWEGWYVAFGTGFLYGVSDLIAIGVDLRFILPQWQTYMFDYGEIEPEPTETPSAFVFNPMLTLMFQL